jgi:hypothetical protein
VIVNGLMHARPGIKVNARDQNTLAPPATSRNPATRPKPDDDGRWLERRLDAHLSLLH